MYGPGVRGLREGDGKETKSRRKESRKPAQLEQAQVSDRQELGGADTTDTAKYGVDDWRTTAAATLVPMTQLIRGSRSAKRNQARGGAKEGGMGASAANGREH